MQRHTRLQNYQSSVNLANSEATQEHMGGCNATHVLQAQKLARQMETILENVDSAVNPAHQECIEVQIFRSIQCCPGVFSAPSVIILLNQHRLPVLAVLQASLQTQMVVQFVQDALLGLSQIHRV